VISVGIDVGSKYTKVIVIKDDKEILGKSIDETGFDVKAKTTEMFKSTLKQAGINEKEVGNVTVTAIRKELVPFANREVPKVVAIAKGAYFISPNVRTVIDAGAEEVVAVKVAEDGKFTDYAVSEKCAAGSGAFIDAMVNALGEPYEKFGELALEGTQDIPINDQCVIFAESEVVGLVSSNVPLSNISRAIHVALADRISSIAKKIGIEEEVMIIGGLANDVGLITFMEKNLNVKVNVPSEIKPQLVTAIGAALSY